LKGKKMNENMTVCSPAAACDSLAAWLNQELKTLGKKEVDIRRTKPSEEREKLLFAVADEFEEIRKTLKDLQECREAAEKEYLDAR
jgi:hypothetical protein